MKKVFVLFLLFFFGISQTVEAASLSDVLINEIAWMGTASSANDEWIELYNNTESPIDLTGWTLRAADGAPEISLAGTISSQRFYLMERTDDNTVADVGADLIYKGALSNTGEDLWLYDEQNNLIDEANFTAGWTAGDNKTKQTMERMGDIWQTSENAGGTPKNANSGGNAEQPAETDTNEEVAIPAKEETKTIEENKVYPTGIVINEILANPEGADEENEWIELYNQNDFEVDLSGWKIKDGNGKITTYEITSTIPSNGFLIFNRKDTKITLNNDADTIVLLFPNEKIADSVSFEKAPLGQSYNKVSNGFAWSSTQTPGSKNIISSPSVASEAGADDLPNEEKFDNNKAMDLAALSQGIKTQSKNPWLLFLTAVIITAIAGTIVFFIKYKLNKHVRT